MILTGQISYQNTSIISRIWQRCYLAYIAFTSDLTPCIKMKNGIIVDLDNQRLIIPGDFNLHTTGNLKFSADKHIIIKSGQIPEERPGYVYGVWINSEEDSYGNPLLDINTKYIEGDHNGIT
jgi:hypothetical protein